MQDSLNLCKLLVPIVAVMALCTPANAQLIATPNIDQLCKTAPVLTYRKTVVYVDLAAIQGNKQDWGLAILNRLELAPRENLAIIGVNPNTFEIKEVFDSCYPILSASEMQDSRTNRGIVDRLTTLDPADQQRENLQTFDARLRNSLDQVIAQSNKYRAGDRQNILGAIAFDKDRFSDPKAFYRLIIYTDGSLKDASLDTKATTASFEALIKQYSASFAGSEVQVFGINGVLSSTALDQRKETFSAFFLKNWAHLKSFAPSLPQQESSLFPPAVRISGTFQGGGTQGSVKLALFAGKKGEEATGWLAFNVGVGALYVPFDGTYRCSSDGCTLNATSSETVPPDSPNPYFRRGDQISLTGKNGGALEGALQAPNQEVFKEGNQSVSYTLKFLTQ
jgi:hypothetical protein